MPVPCIHKQLGKGLDNGEIGDKLGVGALAACEEVNTWGTDENLFRLAPVLPEYYPRS